MDRTKTGTIVLFATLAVASVSCSTGASNQAALTSVAVPAIPPGEGTLWSDPLWQLGIGSAMPCEPSPNERYVIASAQTAPGCGVRAGGIMYFVATIDGRTVAYISTRDPRFITPEGLRVGSTGLEVTEKGGSQVLGETGWRYFARLPSGWCAMFPGIPGISVEELTPPETSTVYEFFKRK